MDERARVARLCVMCVATTHPPNHPPTYLPTERDRDDCWLEHPGPLDEVIDLSKPDTWADKDATHTIAPGEEGLYSLVFVRCRPPLSSVSFKINAKFYNPGRSHPPTHPPTCLPPPPPPPNPLGKRRRFECAAVRHGWKENPPTHPPTHPPTPQDRTICLLEKHPCPPFTSSSSSSTPWP